MKRSIFILFLFCFYSSGMVLNQLSAIAHWLYNGAMITAKAGAAGATTY